jgi:hypothetical protein
MSKEIQSPGATLSIPALYLSRTTYNATMPSFSRVPGPTASGVYLRHTIASTLTMELSQQGPRPYCIAPVPRYTNAIPIATYTPLSSSLGSQALGNRPGTAWPISFAF